MTTKKTFLTSVCLSFALALLSGCAALIPGPPDPKFPPPDGSASMMMPEHAYTVGRAIHDVMALNHFREEIRSDFNVPQKFWVFEEEVHKVERPGVRFKDTVTPPPRMRLIFRVDASGSGSSVKLAGYWKSAEPGRETFLATLEPFLKSMGAYTAGEISLEKVVRFTQESQGSARGFQ